MQRFRRSRNALYSSAGQNTVKMTELIQHKNRPAGNWGAYVLSIRPIVESMKVGKKLLPYVIPEEAREREPIKCPICGNEAGSEDCKRARIF